MICTDSYIRISNNVHDDEAILFRRLYVKTSYLVESTRLNTANDVYSYASDALSVKPVPIIADFFSQVPQNFPSKTPIVLDLSLCYVSKYAMIAFFIALPYCLSLTHLSFRNQQLRTPHVILLCEVCAMLPSLQYLDLSNNPFGALAGDCILALLRARKNLHQCILDDVQLIGSQRKKIEKQISMNIHQLLTHKFVTKNI